MTGRLLTRTEAAKYLGRHRKTLEEWDKRDIGPAIINLPSGRPGYTVEDLDAFIEMHRKNPSDRG